LAEKEAPLQSSKFRLRSLREVIPGCVDSSIK
jgi:hypothetical protein